MTILADFETIKDNLCKSTKKSVTALHKFVFGSEGDRANRRRLRQFEGFEYTTDDDEYKAKSAYVDLELSEADLTTICVILGLNYDVENKKLHIFNNLIKGQLLKFSDQEDDDQEDDDQEDDDQEDDDQQDDDQQRDYQDGDVVQEDACQRNDDREDGHQQMQSRAANSRRNIRSANQEIISVSALSIDERRTQNRRPQQTRFAMNFRDIEDSVKPFDGSSGSSVADWVQEFEETAAVMMWDQLQMLVFAKKSLKGLAKLFVQGERHLTSWSKLKEALLSEFECRLQGRQLHQKLRETTMTRGESAMEYLYNMREIASNGDIDEKELILYVIEGIRDVNTNKQMLYGARNMREFKEKLRDYEDYVGQTNRRNADKKPVMQQEQVSAEKKTGAIKKKGDSPNMRCYNCGEAGHKSSACTNKSKGTKCFQCGNFGHVAKECNAGKKIEVQKKVYQIVAEDDDMTKKVKINNYTRDALIDSGSKVNVIRSKVYKELQLPEMNSTNARLKGYGSRNGTDIPVGSATLDVEIDDEVYVLMFYVVADDSTDYDIIIGAPLKKQAEVVMNPEGICIRKWVPASIMNIEVHNEKDQPYEINEAASAEAKSAVAKIISEYVPEAEKTTNVTMKLILTDETPIASGPRRLPFSEKQIVEAQVDEWLENKIIENSESEFCSPIVLVGKKDGSKRLCVDYRRINKVIVRDRFPLPRIDDQLDRLEKGKVYSTIDLKNGYFHVPVEEGSRKYTSFVTHNGQYQFCRVPFGLANSPAVFQRFVNAVFRELTQKGIALPYVDDIIIPAENEDEAVKNLNEVLSVAKKYGLQLNLKKCNFLQRRIEFVGHVVEGGFIAPSPRKIQAVVNFKTPENHKHLHSFLGLAGYFRKFIKNFATIAKPLSDLLKDGVKFKFGEEQMAAFNHLKQLLSENPVLKIFNPSLETELHTDASIDGYGAVLLQRSPEDGELHPVYFMSKKTTCAERKYCSYELEVLAIIEAVKRFRVYLIGLHFKIITDCNAFTKTMEKKDLGTRVSRWAMLLQEYDHTIEHRAGVRMKHVDALSRYPIMTISDTSSVAKMRQAQQQSEELRAIIDILQEKTNYKDYFLKSGVLYKLVKDSELLVVPSGMQKEIIRATHEKGHMGARKTKEVIERDYYIPKLEEKVQQYISCCVPCVLINRKCGKQEGHLSPLDKGEVPLRTYHIDFVGPLETTSKLYKHILVVVDAFSKFCWLYPTKTTSSACAIKCLMVQNTNFGNPEQIISDRGAAFTSEDFKTYCEAQNIKHLTVTTGLPRANGQVERINAIVVSILAKVAVDDPSKWYKFVATVQQCINSTVSRSTNHTPFELMVGVKMRLKDDVRIKSVVEAEMLNKFQQERDEMREEAKQQLCKIQQENRHNYNLRRKPAPLYSVGEMVAIKRTQFGGGLKLKPKYFGPYEIIRVKANNTYDVIKQGETEGPFRTTTCAEYMKRWPNDGMEDDDGFGAKQ